MNNTVTIRQRPWDIDFMTCLNKAAARCDRSPAHFARQVLIFGLLHLGELELEDLNDLQKSYQDGFVGALGCGVIPS